MFPQILAPIKKHQTSRNLSKDIRKSCLICTYFSLDKYVHLFEQVYTSASTSTYLFLIDAQKKTAARRAAVFCREKWVLLILRRFDEVDCGQRLLELLTGDEARQDALHLVAGDQLDLL